MSKSAKASLATITVLGLFVLAIFNNCQPLAESFYSSDGSSTGGGGTGGFPVTEAPGPNYFQNTLKPLLENRCSFCHDLPFRVAPNPAGPLHIFEYAFMKNKASAGPSSDNNPLINKVRGGDNHPGGNQCPFDAGGTVSPCREIKEWVSLEYPLFADGMAGGIIYTSAFGSVRGWAIDPMNPDLAIQVLVYINGPVGQGILIAETLANLPGDGVQNGHYFQITIPENFRDGVQRGLYVYGVTAVADNLVPNMPYQFAAYTPNPLGRDFYENNLRPQLNQCAECHAVNYEQHYFNLITPSPIAGGLPNNNDLINYMNGENGHRGGSFCGGNKNSGRCLLVQQWWQLEFGN